MRDILFLLADVNTERGICGGVWYWSWMDGLAGSFLMVNDVPSSCEKESLGCLGGRDTGWTRETTNWTKSWSLLDSRKDIGECWCICGWEITWDRVNIAQLEGGDISRDIPVSMRSKGELGVGIGFCEPYGRVSRHDPRVRDDGGYDECEKFPSQNPK